MTENFMITGTKIKILSSITIKIWPIVSVAMIKLQKYDTLWVLNWF